jgi:RNA polymerase sigma-70 factor (ECF subfamily)
VTPFDSHVFDPALVARLARGDRSAAREVYDRLAPTVLTLATRLLKDRSAALEVTQDTFVDVIEKASSLARHDALAAWVRRIAVNHCLSRIRSPWYRRRVLVDDDEELADADGAPRLDESRDLDAALARLPGLTRVVLWMHDVEGHTHREIAALLGRTESFSKSQLSRAHRRLKEWFDGADTGTRRSRSNGAHRAPS